MKIDSGGINQIMSQMQKTRRDSGISRHALQMQKGPEPQSSGFASQLSGEMGKVSESFDSIDSDQKGLLSQFEMESYTKSQSSALSHMTDNNPSSNNPSSGKGKPPRDRLGKLLEKAKAAAEEEEEEEEALALEKLLSRNSKEEKLIVENLFSNTETTSSQESSNQLRQALREHAIEAYSSRQDTGTELLKAIS